MRATISISILALILFACKPQGPEYYEELDLVYTSFDPEYDFSGSSTYAMPDSVVKITGDIVEGENPEFVREPYNTQILESIEAKMTEYGYTRVADPATADYVMMPASWTNTTIYYWYDYWCWYYPWYCGWGYYYPGYAISFTTGTMVLSLVVNSEVSIEPYKVWTGGINGVLSGAFDITRVERGIDQAFDQSPYLRIN